MTDPSSITSVTEEEISDESDTTESTNSKLSDSVSSIMYSSECNTDDKLTSSLVNISISNQNSNHYSKKRSRKVSDRSKDASLDLDSVSTTSSVRAHPSLFDKKAKVDQARSKKKHKCVHSTSLTKYILQKKLFNKAKTFLPKQPDEDFGFDDPNNSVYTDYSDTSTVPPDCNFNANHSVDSVYEEDNVSIHNDETEDENQRPLFPDLNSGVWFQARCFDRYWSHYGFVMEWYRQHVLAVGALSHQINMHNIGVQIPAPVSTTTPTKPASKKKRVKRAKNRARNRRLAKARMKAAQAAVLEEELANEAGEMLDSNSDDSDQEMEITDEMMDFFATSYKHRMERDDKKKETDDCDGNNADNFNGNLSKDGLVGPREQPGVRRASEMRSLYGEGSPMIHGMETALQMTYDKTLDRHGPKMWPNMPLKIKFA